MKLENTQKHKTDNVIYLQQKAPPEFKKFADVYFAEMKRLREEAEAKS